MNRLVVVIVGIFAIYALIGAAVLYFGSSTAKTLTPDVPFLPASLVTTLTDCVNGPAGYYIDASGFGPNQVYTYIYEYDGAYNFGCGIFPPQYQSIQTTIQMPINPSFQISEINAINNNKLSWQRLQQAINSDYVPETCGAGVIPGNLATCTTNYRYQIIADMKMQALLNATNAYILSAYQTTCVQPSVTSTTITSATSAPATTAASAPATTAASTTPPSTIPPSTAPATATITPPPAPLTGFFAWVWNIIKGIFGR